MLEVQEIGQQFHPYADPVSVNDMRGITRG